MLLAHRGLASLAPSLDISIEPGSLSMEEEGGEVRALQGEDASFAHRGLAGLAPSLPHLQSAFLLIGTRIFRSQRPCRSSSLSSLSALRSASLLIGMRIRHPKGRDSALPRLGEEEGGEVRALQGEDPSP
jgi:hypothetical protein